jgi:hypothetical protein
VDGRLDRRSRALAPPGARLAGDADLVAPGDHLEVWLLDSEDPAANQHLEFVLDDAAAAVQMFRSEGKRVLLHCVVAEQRTPSVALRYAVRRGADAPKAADAIRHVLPSTRGHSRLWDVAMLADPLVRASEAAHPPRHCRS